MLDPRLIRTEPDKVRRGLKAGVKIPRSLTGSLRSTKNAEDYLPKSKLSRLNGIESPKKSRR